MPAPQPAQRRPPPSFSRPALPCTHHRNLETNETSWSTPRTAAPGRSPSVPPPSDQAWLAAAGVAWEAGSRTPPWGGSIGRVNRWGSPKPVHSTRKSSLGSDLSDYAHATVHATTHHTMHACAHTRHRTEPSSHCCAPFRRLLATVTTRSCRAPRPTRPRRPSAAPRVSAPSAPPPPKRASSPPLSRLGTARRRRCQICTTWLL